MTRQTGTPEGVGSGPSRVLVGVDGSASSKEALRWAWRQSRATGAELHVVAVWSDPAAFGYVWQATQWVDAEHETRLALDRVLTQVLGEGAGSVAGRQVRHGRPAAALLAATRPGDLLVVGSHGRGGLAGTLLGSVSHAVVAHAGCPVVVVRQDCGRGPGPEAES
jgi:nucleotide-binding universal stress UspA family protein